MFQPRSVFLYPRFKTKVLLNLGSKSFVIRTKKSPWIEFEVRLVTALNFALLLTMLNVDKSLGSLELQILLALRASFLIKSLNLSRKNFDKLILYLIIFLLGFK